MIDRSEEQLGRDRKRDREWEDSRLIDFSFRRERKKDKRGKGRGWLKYFMIDRSGDTEKEIGRGARERKNKRRESEGDIRRERHHTENQSKQSYIHLCFACNVIYAHQERRLQWLKSLAHRNLWGNNLDSSLHHLQPSNPWLSEALFLWLPLTPCLQ